MKKALLVVFAVLFMQTVFCQSGDPRLTGIDTMINRILNEWHVPGASVTVVAKNKTIMSKGYGYKDAENKQPVTSQTAFAIGSCTKAFTASLIGQTAESNKINLDIPVTNYYPELKFYHNNLTTDVTIRDMLSHRTGLPRHDYSWYSGAATSRDSLTALIRYLEPSAPLRQTFQYNNYMYMVLGSLLEKLHAKSWETLVEEKLFVPLGMNRSSTSILSEQKDFAYGYIYKNNQVIRLEFLTAAVKGIAPAGGISSTADDMAKWLLMWTNEGKLNGQQIIPVDFYRQAISSQMIASANLPTAKIPDYYFFNYGFGWYSANYRGHYGVGHGGNINGFSSFISLLPADSIGIYIAVNQNNSAVPRILCNLIADRMIEAPFRDWNALMKTPGGSNNAAPVTQPSVYKPSHPAEAFNGIYKSEGYGLMTIQTEKGKIIGTFNRWKIKTEHLHHNYYKIFIDEPVFDGSEDLTAQFMINPDGQIDALQVVFEDGVKPIEFKRQQNAQSASVDLRIYTGDYDFNGTVIKVELTNTNSLQVLIPGQPTQEMIYKEQDVFLLKAIKGVVIRFNRDAKGAIPSATFNQSNGTFIVKRITQSTETGSKEPAVSKEQLQHYAAYTGEYLMGGQTVSISLKKNDLIASLPGQPVFVLEPAEEQVFKVKGVKGYSVKFQLDQNGKATGFTLKLPNGTQKATRK